MSTDDRAEAPANRAAIKGPRFGDFSEIAIVLVFVAIVHYLSLTTSSFLSAPNVMAILVATSLIAVVACGQTFVIITGGIDLSSGSVVALSGVITGLVMHAGLPIWASIGVGILVGLGCGLFNGLSVTYLNMSPFIVTLAAMSMARGLAFIIPNGRQYSASMTPSTRLAAASGQYPALAERRLPVSFLWPPSLSAPLS
jgi:ribose transport system permease protein